VGRMWEGRRRATRDGKVHKENGLKLEVQFAENSTVSRSVFKFGEIERRALVATVASYVGPTLARALAFRRTRVSCTRVRSADRSLAFVCLSAD
jgi:hypothetical protein